MWQHSFALQIQTELLLAKYVDTCYWTQIRFILEHLIQIKVATQLVVIDSKNSTKSDSFVKPDLPAFYWKSFLR